MTSSADMPRWKARFFSLWGGQALSLFGSSLVQFALVWWLTQETGSATVLATATLAALLPNIVLGPAAGVLIDRFSRRAVMIIADSLVALFTLGLALLFAAGLAEVWHVYVVLLLRGAAGSFQLPAMKASTSLMVPEQQLSRVAGFNQTLNGAMTIVAPPVGALLLQTLPLQGVLAIDVVTALVGMSPLFFIRIPQPRRPEPAPGAARPSFFGEMRAGLAYVVTWPGVMAMLLIVMLVNFLLGPTSAMLPLLVTNHFNGGAMHLATFNSAFGIGMVAGGLLLGAWGGFKRRILTSLVGLTGIGLGNLLLGLTPGSLYWVGVAMIFSVAVMVALTNGPIIAVLQKTVAPEMQGRVFALITSLATAIMPLSLMIAGPVADLTSVRTWFIFSGLACTLLGVLTFFIPAITNMEAQRSREPAAPAAAPAPMPSAD
jgi:MFS transporter, DHA3 family, macrolide efflux protein